VTVIHKTGSHPH